MFINTFDNKDCNDNQKELEDVDDEKSDKPNRDKENLEGKKDN